MAGVVFFVFDSLAYFNIFVINKKKDDMLATQLTPAQLNVLNLMSYIDTVAEQQELQEILLNFYRRKLDSLLLDFKSENNITQQTLDDWANQHERTPYK